LNLESSVWVVETQFSEIGKNSGKLSRKSFLPFETKKKPLLAFSKAIIVLFLGKKINLPSRETAGRWRS
jgi:hypothetical protein